MLLNLESRKKVFMITLFLLIYSAQAQIADFPEDTVAGIPVNYNEAKVGDYSLPDPLKCVDGQMVDNIDTWHNKRRGEIVALFEQHQFGKSPIAPKNIRFDVSDRHSLAFDGKAKRTQATIYFSNAADEPKMDLLMYVPSKAIKPVPILLCISFRANSMAVDDPGINVGFYWNREREKVRANKGHTDKWSDPYGEFLAAVAAEPVYKLFGKEGLITDKMPAAGQPILNDIGFYMHDGGHGLDPSDWNVITDFLEKHFEP